MVALKEPRKGEQGGQSFSVLSGGRRFTCVRKWRLWKHYSDYFPLKVSHKDVNGSLSEHLGQTWGTGYSHMDGGPGTSDSWTRTLPSLNC